MKKKDCKNCISDEMLSKLKKEASESLAFARQQILIEHPFIGSIMMRMNLIPVRDKRMRTACTDGRNVFFDIGYLTTLNQDEQKFVLAHELWHCVMLHFARKQTRLASLFNIATDKEVNNILKEDGMTPPDGVLLPDNGEIGLSAEEIYEGLVKLANKMKRQSEGSGNSQSGGKGEPGSKIKGQFDKHVYSDNENDSSESDGSVSDQYGDVGYDDDYTPSVSDDAAERMREAAISASQFCERTKGDLPAHIKRVVQKYVKPEISWKELLAQFVTSCYNGQSSWIPPNRRYVYRDMYLQSRRHPEIEVAVAIDTSGSTSADLPKFLSELKSLLESFGGYDLTLIQCDAKVDSVEHYDDTNPFPTEIGKEFVFGGGGGTSFVPVFDYLYDNDIRPSCLLYFTDSYGDAPKNPPPFPVLWVLTNDGNEKFCKWGTKIKFKEKSC